MSDSWLTPSSPGTVALVHLEQVRELHVTARNWIAASAAAQENAHFPVNLPYVDPMFAFGLATFGDHARSRCPAGDGRSGLRGDVGV